jgi:hypothetical protein
MFGMILFVFSSFGKKVSTSKISEQQQLTVSSAQTFIANPMLYRQLFPKLIQLCL